LLDRQSSTDRQLYNENKDRKKMKELKEKTPNFPVFKITFAGSQKYTGYYFYICKLF